MTALMSSMKLAIYPIVALVLFSLAFALILFRVFSRRENPELERAGMIPIDDNIVTPVSTSPNTPSTSPRRIS